MGIIVQIFVSLCAIFPTWFVVVFLGFLSLLVIFLVIKIVTFVKNAIPFL